VTVTCWVRFAWLGWYPPVTGDGASAAQAGRTIPIRFGVDGAGQSNVIGRVQVAPVAFGGDAAVAAGDAWGDADCSAQFRAPAHVRLPVAGR
jgi:hypothetical protein